MDSNEQQMIRGLFGRINEAERQAPPRDPEAEQFIRRSVEQQPAAPYYMAQTMIVQEEALKAANARIQELEAQARERPAASSGGGFLGSLFGGGASSREPQRPPQGFGQGGGYGQPQAPASRGGPWSGQAAAGSAGMQQPYGQQNGMMGGRGGGGGFLAGAAQTAVGVAGGVMLGSMLGNMFSGGDPFGGAEQTADNAAGETVNETGAEPAVDSGGDYDRAAYEDGGVQDASFDDYDAGGDFDEI